MKFLESAQGREGWYPGLAMPATGRGAAHTPAELALAVVDEIGCGTIVCDERGLVDFANQAAQRELLAADVLALSGEQLRRPAQGGAEFDLALRQAAQRGKRSLVQLGSGAQRLLVSVLPMAPDDAGRARVLLLLGRRQPCSDLGLELLAGHYGLTLAERRVLAGLLREASPREIAAEHGVSLTTVRTQVSSIRAKLGCRTVEAVLLRAAELPPVASALRVSGLGPGLGRTGEAAAARSALASPGALAVA